MIDGNGRSEQVKSLMDSEGMALRNGQVLVGYEGKHRVDVHPDPGFAHSGPRDSLPILIPRRELRINRGLETVAVSPQSGPLEGGVVVVAELSLDQNGNLFAAVLDGPRQGIFSVARDGNYAVTDGAFLPDGDLLLLERRFNFADGLGMQIRRIKADAIKPGATVEGAVIMQADMGYQIDNMEGLDIIAGPGGDTRVIVVSDDNHSILERNLMLEFRLVE